MLIVVLGEQRVMILEGEYMHTALAKRLDPHDEIQKLAVRVQQLAPAC